MHYYQARARQVSGLNAMQCNATDFCVWGFGGSFFCTGVLGDGILSLAFCPEIGSLLIYMIYYKAVVEI